MEATRPPARPPAWQRFHVPALALIFAVAFAPFAASAWRGETPFFLDIRNHWYPYRLNAHLAHAEGVLPHWCRFQFCGMPFLGQGEAGAFFPPHWLFDRFPPERTLLVQVVLYRFLLGAGMYAALLAGGVRRFAAATGAALVVVCGFATVAVQQPAHLRTLAMLPVLLWGTLRIARGSRLGGACGIAAGTALALVAGYPAFFFRAIFLVPVVLALWPGRDVRTRLLDVGAGAFAGVLGVAVAAVQVLPSMHVAAESQRALGLAPGFVDEFRAAVPDLGMLVLPRFDADGGVVRAGFAYVGLPCIAAAVLALVRRRAGVAAFGTVAMVGLVASLGSATPLGALVQSLPVFSMFKNPSQHLVLWCLGVAGLAALGIDAAMERLPTRIEAAICAGTSALLLAVAALTNGMPAPRSLETQRLVVCSVALGVVIAAVALARVGTWGCRASATLFLLACVADPASLGLRYTTRAGRSVPLADAGRADAPFVAIRDRHAARTAEGPPRAITSDREFNWDARGASAGVENVRGLSSLVPMRTLDAGRLVTDGAPFERRPAEVPLYDWGPTRGLGSPLIDLLAIRYAAGWDEAPGPGWTSIGRGAWERDAAPVARIVRRPIRVDPGADAWREIVRPGFDARNDAVVESASDLPAQAGEGAVEFLRVGVNGVEMEGASEGPSVLLWTETWDAGWTVTVDRRPGDVLRANHAFLAVVIPGGRCRVVWTYESPGFRTGAWISAVALVGLGVLGGVAWRRGLRAGGGGSSSGEG